MANHLPPDAIAEAMLLAMAEDPPEAMLVARAEAAA